MMRYLSIFTFLFLNFNASAKDVLIKWHGQSFFEIKSSKGTILAIDPHNLEAYGRREVKADAVLISHYHIDHTAPEPITNWDKTKKLYGLKKKDGSPPGKNEEFNEFDEKVEDIRIQSIGSYHDNMQGLKRGKNSIFILEIDGLRIVHLGDLGHLLTQAQIKAIGKVDVLMIPVGGIYTLNGAEAKQVVEQLKPRRHILPMHYGTKVYDFLVGPDEFLEDQEEKLIKRYKHNELTIDADAEPKKDPTIILLSYEPK
jgi:L-ascorbate metabolism protein UlaG (beta-lactamase superfamily)